MRDSRRSLLRKTCATLGIGSLVGVSSKTASADHQYNDVPAAADYYNPIPSCNYTSEDRHTWDIDWVVLHLTNGTAGGTESWLNNCDANVSYHAMVSNYSGTSYDPGDVVQFVGLSDRAWHARCSNHNSIGLSIEWHPDYGGVSWSAYDAAAEYVDEMIRALGIPDNVISNDSFDGQTPVCNYNGGIIGHRDAVDSSCDCWDTIPTRCPDPDGFSFSTFEDHLARYR